MPFQLSGQAVTTKSSRLLHVAGCDRAFVVAAGGAFVTMMSSAADACEHVARRRREPVIAVRQAVRAIVPPTVNCPNTTVQETRQTCLSVLYSSSARLVSTF